MACSAISYDLRDRRRGCTSERLDVHCAPMYRYAEKPALLVLYS
jgi:hypothetical protein